MTLIFGVSSSLYIFGTNEDGESVIGHIFHVEATDEKGNRFVHDINYPSMKWRDNDPDDEDDLSIYVNMV